MKTLLVLAQSFALSFLLGVGSEYLASNLYYHALGASNGRPMPPISQWLFEHLAKWENGSILFIFMLPWALLLVHSLSDRPEINSMERSIRSLNGFIYFALSEALLIVFFTLSSILPVVDNYLTSPGAAPPSAYFPHVLFFAALAGAMVAAIRQFLWRRRAGSKNAHGSAKA